MDKDGFVIYKSFYEPIKELSLEHKGLLLVAIFEYQVNNRIIDLPSECRMAFKFFKNQFDLDVKKYTKICEKRAAVGSKGGTKKRENIAKKESKNNALLANLANASKSSKSKQNLANLADKEKEKEKEKDIEDITHTTYLTDNNFKKENKIKEKILNESGQFLNPLLSAKKNVEQCYICDGFNIDFDNDPFFKPYANADSILRQSLNSWLVKNHKNQMVDKNFICQQITNFAKRQGKWGDLLGISKSFQLGNNNSNIKGDEKK